MSLRSPLSLPYLLQPSFHGGASGNALEFRTQIFLHGPSLQRCPRGELVANFLRNIPDGNLNSHAVILPALTAICNLK